MLTQKDGSMWMGRKVEELREEIPVLAQAALFALLADSPSFEELERKEAEFTLRRIHLITAFFRGFPELYEKLTSATKGKSWTKGESLWALPVGPDGEKGPALRPVLAAVQPWAHTLIVNLLARKEVTPPFDSLPSPLWILKEGQLQEQWPQLTPEQELLRCLLHLLRQKPFPFKRCPNCKKVFSRPPLAKVWTYCSKECANEALLTARRPGRREYMRDYMAMRRKEQKQATAKKQRKAKKQQTLNT
jgi:hypothetical protein